jgi:hypothetical protein
MFSELLTFMGQKHLLCGCTGAGDHLAVQHSADLL